ncbi:MULTISPECIES: DNA replication/repair protein RecF [unclassified Moraxella]|uniref:DNA replication/repair protein RecF n=1 Tax=unclassified Moraxella TaxID=2685852 RepID=UPI003AF76CAB
MQLTDLQIHHFRNLTQLQLPLGGCNVFLGQNGSGKTSILESIYLLSRGKSFRHHQPKHYIQYGFDRTTVFAKLTDPNTDSQTIAIEKAQDASTQLRLNQNSVLTQSPLAKLLPTLLFEPITLNSLETGSQARREILDWLLFHVEQNFHPTWLKYQKILKQRNSLLKQIPHFAQISQWQHQEIQAWDKELGQYAEQIHQLRQPTIEAWQRHFSEQLAVFLPQYADKLRLRYTVGFDSAVGLTATLAERLGQDLELGYTRMGCHRADINVMLDNTSIDENGHSHKHSFPATDVLSRGEKKLLMLSLRLSQLPLLNSVGKVPLVLIDDITAELDDRALGLLLSGLKQVDSQLFITSLSADIVPKLEAIWQQEVKLFHVEQGEVKSNDS